MIVHIYIFSRATWFAYFKLPIDKIPNRSAGILAKIRDHFFKCQWHEAYDILAA